MYQFLVAIFFSTLLAGLLFLLSLMTRFRKRAIKVYGVWLILYATFIAIGTGPIDIQHYQSSAISPYKLPWKSGISRFVSQGNRSFTSHRDEHLYAWDFLMPIGTQILAARSGTVSEIKDNFDGIGLHSNYIIITHNDGTRAMYAHIMKNGSMVNVGSRIDQGQPIAYSGMVGQTINPHLHFVVFDSTDKRSLPITFSDVSGGIPYAGRFYTSMNLAP